jgi:plastocyanin
MSMRIWRIVFVLALAVASAACGKAASGDVHDGPGGPDAEHVVMHDDEFAPGELDLPAGSEVTVEVRNEGSNAHNFTIDALDLSTGAVEPGDVKTATFTVPDGSTEFHCTFHPGMSGTIVAR